MHKKTISIFILSALCCSASVWAAGSMKQGLWDMTIKSDAMKNMPKMSPQQIEKMREMGVNIPQMQDGAMVTKMCVSKEMAESDQPPPQAHPNEAQCQSKNFQRSGNSYSVDIICDGPRMKGEGKARGSHSDKEHFTTSYDFKGTIGGKPVNQHHESSGKWIGEDCGNVKPMSELMRMQKKPQ